VKTNEGSNIRCVIADGEKRVGDDPDVAELASLGAVVIDLAMRCTYRVS
jgi:hypothetical protein